MQPFTFKRLLLAALIAATTVAFTGFSEASPRERASALLDEQANVLVEMYSRDADSAEIHAVIAEFDQRAAPILAQLDDAERVSLEREVEERIAGAVWGMNR
jgi:hypothetical protein